MVHSCFVWLTYPKLRGTIFEMSTLLALLLSLAIFKDTHGIIDSPDPSSSLH